MRHAGKVTTIEKAMNSNAPTIGAFNREKGKSFTEGLVMGWLAYLNSMLNLNKPMTDDQIEMCAVTITEEFYGLKMSDLTLLFKNIIEGKHGEFYESLSPAKVLSFFRQYFTDRCELAEQQSLREHYDDKAKNDNLNFSSNVKRIYQTGAGGFNRK
jgi:hypothetical protein